MSVYSGLAYGRWIFPETKESKWDVIVSIFWRPESNIFNVLKFNRVTKLQLYESQI
jgi:hypothetical protein